MWEIEPSPNITIDDENGDRCDAWKFDDYNEALRTKKQGGQR